MSKELYIWKDGDKYRARFERYDGSIGTEETDEFIGMTCLVKQCLESHARLYKPPKGESGEAISEDQINCMENRALSAYAGDRNMWTPEWDRQQQRCP